MVKQMRLADKRRVYTLESPVEFVESVYPNRLLRDKSFCDVARDSGSSVHHAGEQLNRVRACV